MTADRAGCYRSFASQLELAGEQLLQTFIVHDQHDQVDAFEAYLKSSTAAADGDECGCAPAFSGAAGGHATAVLATKDESAFDHVRYHHDALGIVQHFLGDAFVRRGHNAVNHV